ncbi:hypothetical protein BKM78_11590 [Tessaracoccus sp. T2.5-30]|nr:hypothetical protein BKM78_11590 [Tessaracoccus sp. T2.5-30]
MEKGLSLRGITKRFPGVKALDGVDFDVRYGRSVALIGENGAGKSTLMKVLSGVYIPDEGSMTLDGEPYRPSGPHDSALAGVVLIHQELSLLPNLTLAENIFLGRVPKRHGLVDRRTMNRGAADLLKRVGLGHLEPTTPTASCSVAIQQLVEIAKALSQEPRILVFDEPTASLGQDEVETLYGIVRSLRDEGVGIVWITHRLAEIPAVGDEIVTLRDGARVADWDSSNVAVTELVASMVGRDLDNIYPDLPPATDEVLLTVEGLSRTGEFKDVSFELRRGEILGIAGLVGSGRTELVETIAGARKATSGRILLSGEELRIRSPRDAVARSIVLVPEDRKNQGLAQRLTIEDNIGLPTRGFLRGVVNRAELRDEVLRVKERVNLRGQMFQLAQTLSGGNQQKGVIAKWLSRNPQVFIFDEPTRGIDVGARSAIYQIMRDLAAGGAAVIAVSSELPEVMGISHRVAVLSNGRLTGVLDRQEFSETAIMHLAVEGHQQALVSAGSH